MFADDIDLGVGVNAGGQEDILVQFWQIGEMFWKTINKVLFSKNE